MNDWTSPANPRKNAAAAGSSGFRDKSIGFEVLGKKGGQILSCIQSQGAGSREWLSC